MTVSLISPRVGTSIIKSLAEVAFVPSSVVAIAASAATTVTEATETPPPSTSKPSSSVTAAKASVTTVIELLLLQLWELCGYSQLPTATILPVVLWKD